MPTLSGRRKKRQDMGVPIETKKRTAARIRGVVAIFVRMAPVFVGSWEIELKQFASCGGRVDLIGDWTGVCSSIFPG